ncbi:MAG: hypothetical protein WC340_18415, partial [Kiritimatiellia bacterium]
PIRRRERSVAHGLPWAFYVSREGAKTRRREDAKARRRLFYPQIPQISADFGGLSCRCAAIHAAGKKARTFCGPRLAVGIFCPTRRREGAKKAFLSTDSTD